LAYRLKDYGHEHHPAPQAPLEEIGGVEVRVGLVRNRAANQIASARTWICAATAP
jgi:hypothetical protein